MGYDICRSSIIILRHITLEAEITDLIPKGVVLSIAVYLLKERGVIIGLRIEVHKIRGENPHRVSTIGRVSDAEALQFFIAGAEVLLVPSFILPDRINAEKFSRWINNSTGLNFVSQCSNFKKKYCKKETGETINYYV